MPHTAQRFSRMCRWRGVPCTTKTTTRTAALSPSCDLARRAYVDMSFIADGADPFSSGVAFASDPGAETGSSGAAAGAAAGAVPTYPHPRYVYPLDVSSVSFRLYGEPEAVGDGGVGRLFSSGTQQSYDPATLYQELRAQESGAAAVPIDTQALLKADEEDMDAVMREGRDKQGAASAAAVAAAVIEVSQTTRVEGIAMVPNHPLPVVFPKQDGSTTPRTFSAQSGPTANQLGQARRKAHVDGGDEKGDGLIMSEVMEGDGRIEGYSLHRVSTMRVSVCDEQGRLHRIRRFKTFAEVPHILPRLTHASMLCGLDCPTLLQSAALPLLLDGRDLFVVSPHGSGRALAYALPAIQIVLEQMSVGASNARRTTAETSEATEVETPVVVAPSVLVLCSTKQTVRQRGVVLHNLVDAANDGGVPSPILEGYDRTGSHFCRAASTRDVECLVATAEFVTQQCEAGHLSLHRVRFLAVDDVVESVGYLAGLRTVASLVRRNKLSHQACVWGFKSSPTLLAAAQICLSPHHMKLTVTREVQATTQARQVLYLVSSKDERLSLLQRLFEQRVIQKREQTLICCGYREVAETLAAFLTTSLSAPPSMVKFIHSGVRERRRLAVLNDFHKGDVRILIATGTVLQHVDVAGVNHLVVFDLPATTRTYERRLHSLAPSGTVHVFLTPNDSKVPIVARYVEKITGHTLSDDLRDVVESVERSGGDNDWNVPASLCAHHGAGAGAGAGARGHPVRGKWRVRGKHNQRTVAGTMAEGGGDEDDHTAPLSP